MILTFNLILIFSFFRIGFLQVFKKVEAMMIIYSCQDHCSYVMLNQNDKSLTSLTFLLFLNKNGKYNCGIKQKDNCFLPSVNAITK